MAHTVDFQRGRRSYNCRMVREERQLHLQIEEDEVVYIQVWGANIETEMHVETLYSKDYLTLWKWLLYG